MTYWALAFGIMTVLILATGALSLYALLRSTVAFKAATRLAREVHEEASRLTDEKMAAMEACLKDLSAQLAAAQSPPAPPPQVRPAMNLSKRSQALRMHRQGDSPAAIAAALSLPVQEVHLLIKVHRVVLSCV